MRPRVVLLTMLSGEPLTRLIEAFSRVGACTVVVRDLAELVSAEFDDRSTLVAFGTGVIVPARFLNSLSRPAYNLHAASPAFPGRDPHHHAAFAAVQHYGATLHFLTERVDAGPIIAAEMFDVPSDCRPRQLLGLANDAGLRLLVAYAGRLIAAEPPSPNAELVWGGVKTSRADLIEACRIAKDIDLDEFERRFRAFDGDAHDNLTVEIHGWTFRIVKSAGRYTRLSK